MKLSSFSVILVFVMLMVAGLGMVPYLTVQWRPQKVYPSVTVSYSWSGYSTRTVEQEVTSVLEGVFARMKGVRKVTSVSAQGRGSISINFNEYVDFDALRFEVSTLIRQVYPMLPPGVSYPRVSINQPRSGRRTPVLTYSVNAPGSLSMISTYVQDHMTPALAALRGVAEVEVSGGEGWEWVMSYDALILRAMGLRPSDISTAISSYLSASSAGSGSEVHEDGSLSLIHLVFRNRKPDHLDFLDIPVKSVDGRIFHVRDLVSLRHQEQEPTRYSRLNGANAVTLDLFAEETANQLRVASAIKEKVAALEQLLPRGYFLELHYDVSESILKELKRNVLRTGATLLILLCFVWVASRRLRYLSIIVFSLMANLCIAFGCYYLFDVKIHLFTLAGLAVSLGLILDNSIVMMDHWQHHHNRKVFLATLGATMTTLSSLMVVFFLDENARLILGDFSVLLIVNLIVSLGVALFLIPALMDRFPVREQRRLSVWRRRRRMARLARVYAALVRFSVRRKYWLVAAVVLLFGLPVFMLPKSSGSLTGGTTDETLWRKVYKSTLGSDFFHEEIKPIAEKVLGGTLRLFMQDAGGYSWDRDMQRTMLNVQAKMPYGSSLEQMDEMIRSMEEYLSKVTGVDQYRSSVQAGSATISVSFLEEYEFTGLPYTLQSELIDKARTMDGADWGISGVGRGFSNAVSQQLGRLRITFRGYNLDALLRYAQQCRDSLMTISQRVKEVVIITDDSYTLEPDFEFVASLDPYALMIAGVRPGEVITALGPFDRTKSMAGSVWSPEGSEPLYLISRESQRMDLWQVQHTAAASERGGVRLTDVSTLKREYVSQRIRKEDQQYMVSCTYDYIGSSTGATRLTDRVIRGMKQVLPLGFSVDENSRQYGFGTTGGAKNLFLLLLVIVMIFMTTAILFESLLQPFAVIVMIPVSYIGLFITFPLFDLRFDQGGFAAFVLLTGITVNASLYIMNDYNQLRRRNRLLTGKKTEYQMYMKAFHQKIFPISLTILSTILGFVPFLMFSSNEEFWPSLAAGTIGGLVFSLFGILFFLPAILLRRERRAHRG